MSEHGDERCAGQQRDGTAVQAAGGFHTNARAGEAGEFELGRDHVGPLREDGQAIAAARVFGVESAVNGQRRWSSRA
jgi:hypothetical protein